MKNLLTTQNQNCYREQIEKECYARLAWKNRYGQDYPTCFVSRRAKEPLPKLSQITAQNSTTKASTTKASLPPVLSTLEKREAAGPQDREVPLMRPVTPQTQETLYQGFSKEGKGRSRYLHARTRKAPEEKFDYPLLSSWDYGWRLGDSGREYRSPANGRSGVVKNAFYARNGIFNCTSESDRLG
ncbi:protein ATP6V1FNB isoform X2 [Esox lucius]|uniref:protein ATP6V1FNB isoform X2 n=1 Tax=Esox lucius TaxID=8010 RepID=UPI0009731C14|nr:protein ATP6V1FNB isoform X2 [Esox lucius]